MGTLHSEAEVSRVGLLKKMSKLGIFFTLLIISLVVNAAEIKDDRTPRRQQRLFFVTTESSTLSTSTLCWSPAANIGDYNQVTGGSCSRKKRAMGSDFDELNNQEVDAIQPSASLDSSLDLDLDLVQSQERQARQNNALNFLLYWATTPLTTTSYTKYQTLEVMLPVQCTPEGMVKCSDV